MNKWLSGALVLGLFAAAGHAEQVTQPYAKLKKQIDIMSNIISTSLADDKQWRRARVDVQGVYLKNQGVVFEIDSSRGVSRLVRMFSKDSDFTLDDIDSIPGVPEVPAVPMVFGSGDSTVTIDLGDASDTYEQAVEAWRDRAEHVRELRESQRDLSYQLREIARRKRDLEFEQRHSDKERTAELKKELAEIDKELDKLSKKNDELAKMAQKEEGALKKKREARQAEVRKARQAYFAKLDLAIADTLCHYGAGLRELDKAERVTFVIDLDSNDKGGPEKKIHTFSKKDILSCVVADTNAQQLMKAAQSYYY